MKLHLREIGLSGVAAVLFTASLYAYQDEISPPSSPSRAGSTNLQPAATTPASARSTANPASAWGDCFLASALMGSNVKSPSGENIGQIHDLLIDANGQVRMAILGMGGFLGIGEKRTPVPWQAIEATPDKGLVVRVDRGKLRTGPTIDKNQDSADWANPNFTTEVFAHYGMADTGSIGGTGTGELGTETGKGSEGDAPKGLKDKIKDKTRELKDDIERSTENLKKRLEKK